jgi:DNA-binding PadR family transcriptional regulator
MGKKTKDVVLTPAMFHILLALADGNRHGLGIVREVERRTQGEVRLGPGTLYGSIKKLLRLGHIVEPGERPGPEHDDPRRRYYKISNRGRRVLEIEAARMDRLVQVAREKAVIKGSTAP